MTRGTEWIPLDKYLSQEFKSIKRPFSMIEAMFSLTLDIDNGRQGSVAGYSALWGWSRNKTRRFITGVLDIKGHIKDSKRTVKGQAIHFIDKCLWGKEDSKRTVKGQQKDTTTNPIINNISSNEDIYSDGEPSPSICPQKQIKEKYNSILGDILPKCVSTNQTVEKMVRTRWKEDQQRQTIEWWDNYFHSVKQSKFLTGKTKANFLATFEWLVRPANMSKVLNGNYANREKIQNNDRTTGNIESCNSFINRGVA